MNTLSPTRILDRLCSDDRNHCLKVGAAYAAIYVIWGSTYLAISLAIDTIPPFLMAGGRFITAGALLFTWMWLRGAPRPRAIHWRSALIIGALLLLGGNGAMTWAMQEVPSGLAALIIASIPIWIVIFGMARGGTKPGKRTVGGIVLGFAGIAVLIGPAKLGSATGISPLSLVMILIAPISWALGSLYSRTAPTPGRPLQMIGMQMLCGGALLLTAGTVTGEWSSFQLAAVTSTSFFAWLYLVVLGAVVGFSAYLWLLQVSPPAKVSTYAYVNPVIAVFLGWAFLAEPVTLETMVAMAIILAGVALIASPPKKPRAVPTRHGDVV